MTPEQIAKLPKYAQEYIKSLEAQVAAYENMNFHKYMYHGFRYMILGKEDTEYCYAEPVEYANGCHTGDCLVVNCFGNVDPGYCNKPVVFHRSALGDIIEKE